MRFNTIIISHTALPEQNGQQGNIEHISLVLFLLRKLQLFCAKLAKL
jgi:hypothetical protein